MRSEIEDFASKQVANLIRNILEKASDENLVMLTQLGSRLSSDPDVQKAIAGLQRLLRDPRHPARLIFRRILDYLPSRNRQALFETLFYRGWFLGHKKRNLFKNKNGFAPPFVMILSPTLHCNLRCHGCYTLGYGRRPELSYTLVKRLLKECREIGIHFITVLGGEPFMYPQLFDMVEEHPDIFFQIYTNGTLMSSEKAKRISGLGNSMIVISIEGNEKETDAWRGKGTYSKIMAAFEYLKTEKVLTGTSATVTSQNIEVVGSEEFVDSMIERGSFAQMYFLYLPVNGQADFSLMVRPGQRDYLRRQVIRFRETKPMFFLDFWNDGPHVEGCIAGGRRYFHVNAKGDVEPCVYTHIAVDNIAETPLAQALNSPLFRAVRSRQPHNKNHLRPCMIIDNPHVMREVIRETNPYFTHPGADEIYYRKKDEMDAYANRFGELADQIWLDEYVGKPEPESTDGRE